MNDCLFCAIVNGDIPSTRVFENDKVLAFRDINPQAPTHILVIPKEHLDSVDVLNADNADHALACLLAIPEIARAEGLQNGYRIVSNVGEDGGQSVKHLHFHILGGKKLGENMNCPNM